MTHIIIIASQNYFYLIYDLPRIISHSIGLSISITNIQIRNTNLSTFTVTFLTMPLTFVVHPSARPALVTTGFNFKPPILLNIERGMMLKHVPRSHRSLLRYKSPMDTLEHQGSSSNFGGYCQSKRVLQLLVKATNSLLEGFVFIIKRLLRKLMQQGF